MDGENPHSWPYTPAQSLLGGDGVVQSGQSEILGRTPDQGFIRSVTLINAECESMYGQIVTVVLHATRTQPAPAAGEENEGLPMFARVSFGNGGTQATQQLEVDFINGAMFSVPAGFLRVEALLEPDVVDSNIGMNAGAFVGYYPLGKARQAQRTILAGDIDDGANVVIAIPFFATRFELFSVAAGVTYTVQQTQDAAGLLVVSTSALAAPAPHVTVPLINPARYLRITNTSGGAIASGGTRVAFQLTV